MTTTPNTTASGAADDLRAVFRSLLPDLPDTKPFTLFKAGFRQALATMASAPVAPTQQGEYPGLPQGDVNTGVAEMIAKLRKDLIEELAAQPAPVAEDADPLQGAANWLVTSHATTSATELGGRLCIGYNRAERLFNAARAQAVQPEGGAKHD